MSQQNEKVVELEQVIKPSSVEDNTKNVMEEQDTFTQKITNLFFLNKKNQDLDKDEEQEIVKAIIRDDIENPVPAIEEMIRDEIVEPLLTVSSVIVSSVLEEVVAEELAKKESEVLSSLEELNSAKKLLDTEIDVKIKVSKFFCCYM
jgi:hypothetical protein